MASACKYEMIGHSFGLEFTKARLKPKHERKCRFCGRSYPEAKFKSDAHLIPESLGNTMLFSDFECDHCNNYFGTTYDDHLANYVGLSRIMSFTKNKGKIPAHVQAGKSISIRPDKLNFIKKVDYWIPFIYRPLFLLSPVHLMHPKIFLRDRCNH